MKQLHYIAICTVLTMIGCLFYLYQESWIIFTSPFTHQENINPLAQQNTTYKTVTLYAWDHSDFKKESTDIIYSDNTAQNLKQLLHNWLIFLDDEHLTDKETQIISVVLSPSKQEAFISLNQPPFDKFWSTHQKLIWVEGMLKTIRENKIPITTLRLLVHHQPLQDDHLNFDIPWPIIGFTQK